MPPSARRFSYNFWDLRPPPPLSKILDPPRMNTLKVISMFIYVRINYIPYIEIIMVLSTASGTFKFPFFPCTFHVNSVPCACTFHSVSTRYNRFPCRHAINVNTRFEDTEPIYSTLFYFLGGDITPVTLLTIEGLTFSLDSGCMFCCNTDVYFFCLGKIFVNIFINCFKHLFQLNNFGRIFRIKRRPLSNPREFIISYLELKYKKRHFSSLDRM